MHAWSIGRACFSARHCLLLMLASVFGCSADCAASANPVSAAAGTLMTIPAQARTDYVEHCGGCHGVDGRSAPAQVPELHDRVGYFLCTPGARAYLLRLPNVAHSRITDNQQLADLMNFVVYTLGGPSAPRKALPFTAEEVTRERKQASSSLSLKAERARYVEQAIHTCRAPVALRTFFSRGGLPNGGNHSKP